MFGVDDDADGPIRSRPMRAYLAGVLEHMADLTAVNLPSVNAYKRLKDYTFAPNRVCWAIDNRTAAVRIPPGEAGRAPDGDPLGLRRTRTPT